MFNLGTAQRTELIKKRKLSFKNKKRNIMKNITRNPFSLFHLKKSIYI